MRFAMHYSVLESPQHGLSICSKSCWGDSKTEWCLRNERGFAVGSALYSIYSRSQESIGAMPMKLSLTKITQEVVGTPIFKALLWSLAEKWPFTHRSCPKHTLYSSCIHLLRRDRRCMNDETHQLLMWWKRERRESNVSIDLSSNFYHMYMYV